MDDFEKFYKAAIRYLSFRPRSEKELGDYLAKKECDPLICKRIIDSLTRNKFLNDEEFARMWIRERTLIKPKAIRVIKIELRQKGIGKELIESLFENSDDSPVDLDLAVKLAEKKLRTIHDQTDKYKVKEKLGRYLASKGFDWDNIKAAIDQALAK